MVIGQRVEALDEMNVWRESFIVDETPLQVQVHFRGFHRKYDIWIDKEEPFSRRIRPFERNYHLHRKQHQQQISSSSSSSSSHMTTTNNNSTASSSNLTNTSSSQMIGCQISTRRRGRGILWATKQTGKNQHSADNHENFHDDDDDIDLRYAENNYHKSSNDNNNNTTTEDTREKGRQQIVRYIEEDTRHRQIDAMSSQFLHYRQALEDQQLTIIPMSGDGNCLFRSVAHQIYGDPSLHPLVREKCMDYMEVEADFFSQFIVGGKESFHLYLRAKRMDACWGDDPEIEVVIVIYFI